MSQIHRITLTLLGLMLGLLSPRVASAREPEATHVRVELSGTEMPTHVCMISTAAGSESDVSLSAVFGLSEKDGEWILEASAQHTDQPTHLHEIPEVSGLLPHNSAYGDACKTHAGSELSCRPSFNKLVGDEHRFIQCVTNTSLPTEGDRADRVLVLAVDDPSRDSLKKIAITNLALSDMLLEFDTSHKPSLVTMMLSVRGGYYLPQSAVRITDEREKPAQLTLKPRCSWMELERPPILPKSDPNDQRKLTLGLSETKHKPERKSKFKSGSQDERHLAPLSDSYRDKCLRNDLTSPLMEVLVPTQVTGAKLVIEFATPKRDGEWDSDSVYDGLLLVGNWSGTTPARLQLEIVNFTFSWRAASSFVEPEGDCPKARIHESGLACENISTKVADGVCTYSCPGGKNGTDEKIGLRLSESQGMTIDFESRADGQVTQRWSTNLNYIDQQLVDYVDPSEQVVRVRIGSEYPKIFGKRRRDVADLWVTGDQVYAVALEYTNREGSRTSVELNLADNAQTLNGKLIANLPDANGVNAIRYQYIGERSYLPGYTRVQSGVINLDSPVNLGRQWYITAQVGGGILFPRRAGDYGSTINARIFPSFNLDLGVAYWWLHYPNRTCVYERHGEVDSASPENCRPTAAGRGWRNELRMGVVYSAAPVQPLDGESLGAPNSRFVRVPYLRFGPSLLFLSPWMGLGQHKENEVEKDEKASRLTAFQTNQRDWVQFSLGFGVGGLWGLAARRADIPLFDPSYNYIDFGLRTLLEARARISRRFRLEAYVRHDLFLLEDDVSYSTDGRGQAIVDLGRNTAVRNGLSLGLTVSL